MAFTLPYGLYEFNTMLFGLSNALSTFQRAMTDILDINNTENVLVYIDDILIFSENFEDHIRHIRKTLNKLKNANIKLKTLKCKIAMRNIEYLGFEISKNGIKPSKNGYEAISGCKIPENVNETRHFLGLVNYYRKFVKDLATIARPLYDLLKKDSKFTWSKKQEKAFNEIKERLLKKPILRHADFNKTFIIQTDASKIGLGAILMQKHEDMDVIIQCSSRTLKDIEKNYSATELEYLGVI